MTPSPSNNCSDSDSWMGDELHFDPTINFLFNGLGLFLLALFGISANILSVVVLTHPKLKSSLNTLLLGLTISDVFVIGTSLFIFSLHLVLGRLNIFTSYTTVIRPHILPWLLPIALTAQMSSLYFTVMITLERLILFLIIMIVRTPRNWCYFGFIGGYYFFHLLDTSLFAYHSKPAPFVLVPLHKSSLLGSFLFLYFIIFRGGLNTKRWPS